MFNIAGGQYATVGGGRGNTASFFYNTVGGGLNNNASGDRATVGGGSGNTASLLYSTVGGGNSNTASAYASMVPGGQNCSAAGDWSFAAGRRAKATHQGSFVWCDSLNQDGGSPGADTFTVRASGGVYMVTSGGSTGVQVGPGGGSWSSLSDRNVKENFQTVNAQDVLARVTAMPLSTWNYKSQDKTVRHIGPMAQDFAAAFGVGEDDKHITTVDADGVALAAIQGLNQKLSEQEAALKSKDLEIHELWQAVAELQKTVRKITNKTQE